MGSYHRNRKFSTVVWIRSLENDLKQKLNTERCWYASIGKDMLTRTIDRVMTECSTEMAYLAL